MKVSPRDARKVVSSTALMTSLPYLLMIAAGISGLGRLLSMLPSLWLTAVSDKKDDREVGNRFLGSEGPGRTDCWRYPEVVSGMSGT